MMADELDIAYDKTTCIMGSTDITVDQGGSGGSDAIQTDGWPMRRVAAEARRVLLEMASDAVCGAGRSARRSATAVITVKGDPSKQVTYGELIGGKRFNVTLTGNNVDATTGVAKVKPVQELKIVGQSPQRYDIPAKVDGSLKWAVDAKVPGMVHARNVKPPFAGAKLDQHRRVVRARHSGIHQSREQGQLRCGGVRARRAGDHARPDSSRSNWQKPATAPFPGLGRSRSSTSAARRPTSSQKPNVVGDPDAALAGAATVIEAEYDVPFQGHTAFAPGARHGRSVERSDDDLLQRHEVVRHADRRRAVPRDAAGTGPGRLDGGSAGIRPHRRRRCGVRGGVSGEGDRPAGSRAVDEARRDRLGYQGTGVRVQDSAADWMRRAISSRWTTTLERPTTTTSATTRPTPC